MPDAKNKMAIDEERLTLEKERLSMERAATDKRLAIEANRDNRDSRFFRANLGIIITALVSLGAIAASGIQFYFTKSQQDQKLAQDKQKEADDSQARIDEQNLKVLNYLSEHSADIFSDKIEIQRRYRAIMLTALPQQTLSRVFDQLRQTTPNGDKVWVLGTFAYKFRPTGIGDCSGRDTDLVGTTGDTPDEARCNIGFEGRISVCWDGEHFKNGSRGKWCTYKFATPDTCTGGAAPGTVYQCVALISDSK